MPDATMPVLLHMTDIQELRNLYHAEMLKVHELEQSTERMRADKNAALQTRNDYRRQHEADIQLIGDALLYEADQRSWCDDYDKFVAGVNEQLTVKLPERETEWTVTLTYSVQVRRDFMAVDRAAAIELMENEFDLEDQFHMDNDYTFDVALEESDAEEA